MNYLKKIYNLFLSKYIKFMNVQGKIQNAIKFTLKWVMLNKI